ncbi:hypothetical protein M404DRAFT_1005709 [Pisolithus tinctorius Marx 270]|uniref:Uncharacterized protein n=1 Tax=Pisolithus tinctorius Marx 270 TaxID=870435 RepID=A0A0C3NA72_PISTI|nr:hypothetical protein M404DRAFT_1005709 [Pisolithus tinctorius Marx 270]
MALRAANIWCERLRSILSSHASSARARLTSSIAGRCTVPIASTFSEQRVELRV